MATDYLLLLSCQLNKICCYHGNRLSPKITMTTDYHGGGGCRCKADHTKHAGSTACTGWELNISFLLKIQHVMRVWRRGPSVAGEELLDLTSGWPSWRQLLQQTPVVREQCWDRLTGKGILDQQVCPALEHHNGWCFRTDIYHMVLLFTKEWPVNVGIRAVIWNSNIISMIYIQIVQTGRNW